ncbi:MAG: bifunctional UDP-N-acetylglucosamine diphosphorylase/glucosamine-1-phosphate N-acetyltransferase GlmU [Chloroflexota bacterium]
MAAGLGTRMRSRRPKVLHPVCGRPLLAYVLDVAVGVTGARPVVVISPATEQIRAALGDAVDYAVQDVPRGTADAVRAGLTAVPADATEVIVLNGDVPLMAESVVAALADLRRRHDAAVALVTVDTADPGRLGRVVRDATGAVVRVVEAKDAAPEDLSIGEINAGLYAFDAAWLRRRLPAIEPSPVTGEYYLPLLVELAAADGLTVAAHRVPDDGSLLGVNDRVQLAAAERELHDRLVVRHQLAGVTVLDPATTWLDATVELDEDVILEPNVVLRGRTRVGRDSVIRTGSQLVDSTVGERCTIWASVLESSVVEDDVRIGPFSHLRPGARIGAGAELGNFAEVKASTIGPGSKQHHFSYIGDTVVGANVNIGAGTITANYDGKRKHRTVIGDRAFIGSDTILRAPITIGEDAVTGAGSVVTHDVPPGQTVLGVPAREHRARRAPDEPGS